MAPGATREEGEEIQGQSRVQKGSQGLDWGGERKGGWAGSFQAFPGGGAAVTHLGDSPGLPSSVSAPQTAAPPPEEHSGYSCAVASDMASPQACLIKLPNMKCDRSLEADSEWK